MATSGTWITCTTGQKPPPRAVRSPCKYASYICLWDKDFTLGRASDNLHRSGLDAWFPYGGLEHNPGRFSVLVDDGTVRYEWRRVVEVQDRDSVFQPFTVHGYSPMVVGEILGKGSVRLMQAWTSFDGKERTHDGQEVINAMVLCTKRPEPAVAGQAKSGWRQICLNRYPDISVHMLTTRKVAEGVESVNNATDFPGNVRVRVDYESEEGHEWRPLGDEKCSLRTVVNAENIIEQLADANIPLGVALIASPDRKHIERRPATMERAFVVPAQTYAKVTMVVHKQELALKCAATETTYDGYGAMLLQRPVQGVWRAVTTHNVHVEWTETRARLGTLESASLGFRSMSLE